MDAVGETGNQASGIETGNGGNPVFADVVIHNKVNYIQGTLRSYVDFLSTTNTPKYSELTTTLRENWAQPRQKLHFVPAMDPPPGDAAARMQI
jgi:hypothetical protein